MAIDSKGNNHQPKGTPNAGKFAPKAGAGDDDDLWYKPRYLVGAGGHSMGRQVRAQGGCGRRRYGRIPTVYDRGAVRDGRPGLRRGRRGGRPGPR